MDIEGALEYLEQDCYDAPPISWDSGREWDTYDDLADTELSGFGLENYYQRKANFLDRGVPWSVAKTTLAHLIDCGEITKEMRAAFNKKWRKSHRAEIAVKARERYRLKKGD